MDPSFSNAALAARALPMVLLLLLLLLELCIGLRVVDEDDAVDDDDECGVVEPSGGAGMERSNRWSRSGVMWKSGKRMTNKWRRTLSK